MSDLQYDEPKIENIPLSVSEIRNPLIDDSVSHGDQADKSVPHPNNNEYYEEFEIDKDKNRYADDDHNDIPPTLEEWRFILKQGLLSPTGGCEKAW